MAHLRIDQAACQGNGVCFLGWPHLFDLREDDGKAVALVDEIPDQLRADAEAAAAGCPEQAIHILDQP